MTENRPAGRLVTFAGRGLSEIPRELAPGFDITDLDLSGNALTAVPEWVVELSQLRSLRLADNQLTALPVGLGSLRHLAELSVQENQLTDLPAELGGLHRLRVLDAGYNRLTEVPVVLRDLPTLRMLSLNGNQLTELPELIGDLDELAALYVGENRLRSVPAAIGRLRALHELYLDANQLADLPDALGDLVLDTLGLQQNLFTTVPGAVLRLPRIRRLWLARNQLSEIPDELGDLPLEELDLSTNNLARLPAGLARLDRDIELRLGDNPWEEPLPALVSGPVDQLMAYLRSLEQAEPQYEAKLLLVGEGAVGKTSLVAALRGEQFVAGRATTHGIERHALEVPHPRLPGITLTLNTWDFGGQEVYRITHQFFFSERALYLVVWVPRQGQEQNEVAGWLRRIRLRVAEVRILVVATHCDERNPELDLPALRAQAGTALVGSHEVDNLSGHGIPELRAQLAEVAAGLPQMGERISVRWAAVARALATLARAQVSRSEYDRVCEDEGLDATEANALVRLLHEQGHVIHYADDDGLRDIVVLQPEWLTRAIGHVLEDRATRDAGGVLDHCRLHEIWTRDGADYPVELYPYFLRLMEKFDVSYRLRDDDGDLDQSLVAQLVPFARPALPWDPDDSLPEGVRDLSLVCRLRDEAPGLIAWLTVRNHRYRTGLYWRHGVFLEDGRDGSQALFVLHSDPTLLTLTVRGAAPTGFFERLRDSLETLVAKRWPGLDYEFHVPCPGNALDSPGPCPGRFRLAALERRRAHGLARVECQECFREYDVLELLTGFPSPATPLQPQLDQMQRTLNEVAAEARGLTRKVDDVGGQVRQVQAHTAQIAAELRTVLKITQAEVSDCPRLFTFVPVPRTGVRRLRVWETSYRLTLWCEEPSGMHARDDASYLIDEWPQWLVTVAPYARLVLSSLRLILPVAGVAGDALLGGDAARTLSRQIDEMRKVIDSAPVERLRKEVESVRAGASADIQATGTQTGGLAPAEGAGLRRFRSVLFELDPAHGFGGLRRVVDPSGDLLWVCPKHYPLYDPGLPDLPAPPAVPAPVS